MLLSILGESIFDNDLWQLPTTVEFRLWFTFMSHIELNRLIGAFASSNKTFLVCALTYGRSPLNLTKRIFSLLKDMRSFCLTNPLSDRSLFVLVENLVMQLDESSVGISIESHSLMSSLIDFFTSNEFFIFYTIN
jgi:hypothetical protein